MFWVPQCYLAKGGCGGVRVCEEKREEKRKRTRLSIFTNTRTLKRHLCHCECLHCALAQLWGGAWAALVQICPLLSLVLSAVTAGRLQEPAEPSLPLQNRNLLWTNRQRRAGSRGRKSAVISLSLLASCPQVTSTGGRKWHSSVLAALKTRQ